MPHLKNKVKGCQTKGFYISNFLTSLTSQDCLQLYIGQMQTTLLMRDDLINNTNLIGEGAKNEVHSLLTSKRIEMGLI